MATNSEGEPFVPTCPVGCVPEVSIYNGLDEGTYTNRDQGYAAPGLSGAAIVGITIGVMLVIILLVLVLLYTVRHHRDPVST